MAATPIRQQGSGSRITKRMHSDSGLWKRLGPKVESLKVLEIVWRQAIEKKDDSAFDSALSAEATRLFGTDFFHRTTTTTTRTSTVSTASASLTNAANSQPPVVVSTTIEPSTTSTSIIPTSTTSTTSSTSTSTSTSTSETTTSVFSTSTSTSVTPSSARSTSAITSAMAMTTVSSVLPTMTMTLQGEGVNGRPATTRANNITTVVLATTIPAVIGLLLFLFYSLYLRRRGGLRAFIRRRSNQFRRDSNYSQSSGSTGRSIDTRQISRPKLLPWMTNPLIASESRLRLDEESPTTTAMSPDLIPPEALMSPPPVRSPSAVRDTKNMEVPFILDLDPPLYDTQMSRTPHENSIQKEIEERIDSLVQKPWGPL